IWYGCCWCHNLCVFIFLCSLFNGGIPTIKKKRIWFINDARHVYAPSAFHGIFENFILGIFATVEGVLLGTLFSKLVFFILENIILGIFATVAGVLLGTLFAKLILLIAENVLIIEETLYFYFPTYAILLTFGSFIVLFLVISIFVPFILRSKKIIELI